MNLSGFAFLAPVICGTLLSAQVPGIKITSPVAGAIVTPGQTLTITISPVGATVIQQAMAWMLPFAGQVPAVLQNAPFQTSVQVPLGQIGTLSIIAIASDSQGDSLDDSISVIVKPTSPATSISVSPNKIPFSSANGQLRSVSVSATFQDGSTGDVTTSPDSAYQSSSTNVATVSSIGQVQAVAPGTSNILVSYGGFSATIPVSVGVPFMIVGASVSGASVTVDGMILTTAQAFSWVPGSAHTVSAASPQPAGAGTQLVFTGWSDGGAASHTVITPTIATTFTANFKTQYQLTTSAGIGGTITPSSGFYDAGSVLIAATPSTNYTFTGFTGALTGTLNPQTLTLSNPASVTASFGPAQVAGPNVVGLTQAAATTAITSAGLVVGTVTNAASSTVPAGNVISEAPTAGTQVASGSAVNLVISTGPAVAIITWGNPADILYGSALGATQLNATTSTPGTVVYTPPAGTVLSIGDGQPLRVDFTPADSVHFVPAFKTVVINVKAVTVSGPASLVVTAQLSRDSGTSEVIVNLTVANSGGTTAAAVQVIGVSIGPTSATTALPISLGSIVASGQTGITVRLPGLVGGPGLRVVLSITGSFTGGSFGGNIRVSLP